MYKDLILQDHRVARRSARAAADGGSRYMYIYIYSGGASALVLVLVVHLRSRLRCLARWLRERCGWLAVAEAEEAAEASSSH